MSKSQRLAVETFLKVFDGYVLADVAQSFTCTETEVFAELYEAFNYPGSAAALRKYHAEGDEEGDLHFKGDE
jgi:hypothetical protein